MAIIWPAELIITSIAMLMAHVLLWAAAQLFPVP